VKRQLKPIPFLERLADLLDIGLVEVGDTARRLNPDSQRRDAPVRPARDGRVPLGENLADLRPRLAGLHGAARLGAFVLGSAQRERWFP